MVGGRSVDDGGSLEAGGAATFKFDRSVLFNPLPSNQSPGAFCAPSRIILNMHIRNILVR